MPSLFGSSNLLGKQIGSLSSLTGLGQPQRFDEGLSSTLLDPAQPQFGDISKLSGGSIGFGEQDELTGSYGTGIQKIKGADIGKFGGGSNVAPTSGRSGSVMGGAGNVGGDWSGVERWSDAINQAAQKYNVPANLIKAIMKVESNGDPNAQGAPGVWGPMQVHSGVWGQGPWSYDPVANIMKGAEILAGNYQQYGSWDMAIQAYLGFGTDQFGTTNTSYRDAVMNNWNALNNSMGSAGLGYGGGFGGTTDQAISAMFGQGAAVHDWGEFGAESGNGLYGYGTQYGMNGTQHTGVDVAMPVGTQFFAPMGGRVVCSGTGMGQDAGGGGCGAFNDYYGSGAGRIEVLLDNGVTLIFGHSSQAMVQVGQRVNAGQVLGLSGGMNSPHIHLEARVRDASTPSGWRIVDPRSVLGGSFVSPGGVSGGFAGGNASGGRSYDPYSLLQRMRGY